MGIQPRFAQTRDRVARTQSGAKFAILVPATQLPERVKEASAVKVRFINLAGLSLKLNRSLNV